MPVVVRDGFATSPGCDLLIAPCASRRMCFPSCPVCDHSPKIFSPSHSAFTPEEVPMPQAILVKRMHVSRLLGGMICVHPFPGGAQGPPHEEQAEKRGTQERKGQERPADLVDELQQRYRARKQLRREFLQTLQQQMAALHEHATAMERISDGQQLLREMKKHMRI